MKLKRGRSSTTAFTQASTCLPSIFYNRVPCYQYSTVTAGEVRCIPDGTEVSLAARLPSGQVRYIKGFAFESTPVPKNAYVRRLRVVLSPSRGTTNTR